MPTECEGITYDDSTTLLLSKIIIRGLSTIIIIYDYYYYVRLLLSKIISKIIIIMLSKIINITYIASKSLQWRYMRSQEPQSQAGMPSVAYATPAWWHWWGFVRGPSTKYVTQFLTTFEPLRPPSITLYHVSRNPLP